MPARHWNFQGLQRGWGTSRNRPLKGVEGDWQLFAVHRRGNPANR